MTINCVAKNRIVYSRYKFARFVRVCVSRFIYSWFGLDVATKALAERLAGGSFNLSTFNQCYKTFLGGNLDMPKIKKLNKVCTAEKC